MKTAKEIILPILSLLLICAVATMVVAYVNSITKDVIEHNENAVVEKQQKELIPDAESFERSAASLEGDDYEFHTALKSGGTEALGYIFITSSKGYGGEIKVMTAITPEGEVAGVKILAISETPGLGKKAESDSFLSRYKNKTNVDDLYGKNSVDAISGATISTNAVTEAVDIALKLYSTISGGGLIG